ncbi:hypothetical protein E1286_36750 [Nonomuraea terrae]|uniref:Uncharacterized protein n=1 Tax=Nonomuraea terrae TaxID=2530383 RepID=A0A4R4Y1J8_9ACTN|nr:hypothetical protein [Nonomuraea terrae]TDD37965.1 hypothetical protein E1286_36750 [Nonomuraea terrae]
MNCRPAVVRAIALDAVRAADRPPVDQVPTSLVPPVVPGEHHRDPGRTPCGDVSAARQALASCGRTASRPSTCTASSPARARPWAEVGRRGGARCCGTRAADLHLSPVCSA